ncbi:MAG TPA: hypothetical protein ENK86_01685 [Campylobacterales bacterium]|nr:hypothetical protein [Campylobacterales bacterium]
MKRWFIISLISNLTLWANPNAQQLEPSMQGLMPWLVGFFVIIGVLFWSFFKAMQTKNPKYGYVILVAVLLMIGMFFI